jgi:glyoxylase-like metal-dependent hydrolase (beta-lactamase superfamily II)
MPNPAATIRAFFDEPTNTISYLVWDPATRDGAVIDPVLDWDHRAGEADTASADRILATAREESITIRWVLETHAHADHLTARSSTPATSSPRAATSTACSATASASPSARSGPR